jgi:hypothetical protein
MRKMFCIAPLPAIGTINRRQTRVANEAAKNGIVQAGMKTMVDQ